MVGFQITKIDLKKTELENEEEMIDLLPKWTLQLCWANLKFRTKSFLQVSSVGQAPKHMTISCAFPGTSAVSWIRSETDVRTADRGFIYYTSP